jgi:ABC-type branched-subunit amino acid transport system substrate-binding protein
MKKVTKGFAPLVALALVAAACGGDDAADEPADAPAAADEPADEPAAADEPADEPAAADEPADEPAEEPAELLFDYGVTDDTIRIGLNADLSGPFASLVSQIVVGQEVYFEMVNEMGGVAGREVELVILDNAYDVPTHLANYEEFRLESEEGVVFFTQSTGSPHTAATVEALAEDNLLAIPLTWYSGWADPDLGANVVEINATYCVESMNGVQYLAETFDAETIAIVSLAGEYGQDGAAGAKLAAEALGLEIVYDGEGAIAGGDQTPIVTELVAAQPDIVWITTTPTTFAEIFGGSVAQGLQAQWSGNSPTYSYLLLNTALADALSAYYTFSTYTALWGANDSEGMQLVISEMQKRRPDAIFSDNYVRGFLEAMTAHQILEAAAANGDITRAGILEAFQTAEIDFMGLAPNQTWAGDPNDYIVRESYLYDVDASIFTPDATVSDADGSTGNVLAAGPYAGSLAQGFTYEGPCFVAG